MNKKNYPRKNKSFLFPFLNLVLTVLPRIYFLSFMKKIILSLFLFSSVSATAFFSANTQNHCALPLYMAALQSGMLEGQTAQRGSSVAAQKEAARKKMTGYAEILDEYNKTIRDLDSKIDSIKRKLSKGFGKGSKHVVEQIEEHIKTERSQEEEDATRCDEDEVDEFDTYYHRKKDSYLVKLSNALAPPPFSFALLHKIAEKSLSCLIPSAVGEDAVSTVDPCAGIEDGKYAAGGTLCCKDEKTQSNHDFCEAEPAGDGTKRDPAAEKGPPCLGVSGGFCKKDERCCPPKYPSRRGYCDTSCPEPSAKPPAEAGPECRLNSDCGDNQKCENKKCVAAEAGPECRLNSDCGDNQKCENKKCVAAEAGPECRLNSDCGDNQKCENKKCVAAEAGPECRLNSDCGNNQKCENKKCVAAEAGPECRLNSDCGNNQKCENKKCVAAEAGPECRLNSDCGDNQKCENKKCVAAEAAGGDKDDDDKLTDCDHWKRWRECVDSNGDIEKEDLCGSSRKCRFDGKYSNDRSVEELGRPNDKSKCVSFLDELEELIKQSEQKKKERAEFAKKLDLANADLQRIRIAELEGTASSTTEATDCGPECRLRRMRELKEIIDPGPSGWDIFGNVVGTLGAAALGYYGIREANKLRDAQGLGAQPGYALGLAYPFIMKGLHGGGLFGGNSSSLACSPTVGTMGGNVFQQALLAQQMQYAQQMHYMQQMQLMQAYYSSMPNMMPGMGGQFPNIGAGINFGIPGMGNMIPGMPGANLPPYCMMMMVHPPPPGCGGGMGGGMFPNIGAGINFGIPGMGGMMPGMGGMMGAGNMQAYMQYRQAMMAAHQTYMNNYMQREQAVGDLMSQIAQLEMQIWNIRNGGSMGGNINVNLGGGGNTTGTGTGNVGGGGNTNTNTNTGTGTGGDMLDTTKMIRDF